MRTCAYALKKKLYTQVSRKSRLSAWRTRSRSVFLLLVLESSLARVRDEPKRRRAYVEWQVFLNIQELRKAELDATLVAENVVLSLSVVWPFRALKKAMQTGMSFVSWTQISPLSSRRRRDGAV